MLSIFRRSGIRDHSSYQVINENPEPEIQNERRPWSPGSPLAAPAEGENANCWPPLAHYLAMRPGRELQAN